MTPLADLLDLDAAALDTAALSDAELVEAQRSVGSSMRMLETVAARIAAEIAHRSRGELGHEGLAQKLGARTPELLVQNLTGTSAPTARRLVRVGTLVATSSVAEPWLSSLATAAAAGAISSDAVDVIRTGLGMPSPGIDEDALAEAARWLLTRAPSLTPEALLLLARERRDELDAAGVVDREQQLRASRSSRLFRQADGTTRLVAVLDPESAARVVPLLEAATSPRRGGPRFVDESTNAWAQNLLDDERTTEQITLDALVELIALGARGDSSHIIGRPQQPVRVLVARRDLDAGVGVARLEGQSEPVSIATAERHLCDSGLIEVTVDEAGGVIDLGRAKRFHGGRQRTAIATRDGGCLMPGCDRPPSWSEVHHIVPWSEGGGTSVADGVLLCRHHHLLLHNNGWRIERRGSAYWLHLPPGMGEPVQLETKSAALRRVLAG